MGYKCSGENGRQEVGGEGHKEVPDDAEITTSDRALFSATGQRPGDSVPSRQESSK